MISFIRANLWIPLSFAVIFLVTVFFRPLLPIDETRYLSVAWEMFLRQDWLAPLTVNWQPYHHKPPLLFWLINAVWSLSGPTRWAATIVPVLMGMLSVFLTIILTRNLFPSNPQRTNRVAFIMMGCLPFLVYGSMIMFDVTMTFFVLMALLNLLAFSKTQKKRYVVFMAVILGVGVLTKGPVAYLYSIFPMLLGPLWHQNPVPKAKWYGSCCAAVVLSIIPVLFWLVPVLRQSDSHFAFWLVWEQTAGRITGNFGAAHARPFYFYVPIVFIMMIPWIFFPAFWQRLRLISTQAKLDHGMRFILCWIVPVFISFSIISGKQPHYLVPLIPGIAILITILLEDVKMATLQRLVGACLFVFVCAHIVGSATFLKKYDLMPVVHYVDEHREKDWAYIGQYNGEVTFLGHVTKPIDVVQLNALDDWFKDHPSGYAIIAFRNLDRLKHLTMIMDMPYRGKKIGIFRHKNNSSQLKVGRHHEQSLYPAEEGAPFALLMFYTGFLENADRRYAIESIF